MGQHCFVVVDDDDDDVMKRHFSQRTSLHVFKYTIL